MTEAHTFKLTTAENELGVVIACSEYGRCSLTYGFNLFLKLVLRKF